MDDICCFLCIAFMFFKAHILVNMWVRPCTGSLCNKPSPTMWVALNLHYICMCTCIQYVWTYTYECVQCAVSLNLFLSSSLRLVKGKVVIGQGSSRLAVFSRNEGTYPIQTYCICTHNIHEHVCLSLYFIIIPNIADVLKSSSQ